MKKFKRNLFIIITTLITMLGNMVFPVTSMAAENKVNLYATHDFSGILGREGMNILCAYAVYEKDGIEHPVYCLNLELDGAKPNLSYTVDVNNLITDMEVWRTIINGYPYKSLEELGCATKEEAFLATKQAVYCAIYERDPNTYISLGNEAGDRTLNALKQIVNAARTSTEVKPSATLNIYANSAKWEIDEIDNKCVSKEFEVTAAAGIKDYVVNLSGEIAEGTRITDINNNEKNKFNKGEKFKVIMPIKNIQKDGSFSINLNGEVATKPILYGKAAESHLQNVALTGSIYEAGTGTRTEYYFKNETKIVILKQSQETKEPLKDVKFQILDENKEVLFSDLTTNEEGLIIVENLLPGEYYIQEVETLEGYEVYDKLIKIEPKLNEEVKVTVNNLHNSDIEETEKTYTEIEVEQEKSETVVEQNKTEIKEEQNRTEIKLEENKTEIKIQEEKKEIKENIETIKLPKTGM